MKMCTLDCNQITLWKYRCCFECEKLHKEFVILDLDCKYRCYKIRSGKTTKDNYKDCEGMRRDAA